jgi:hypothetical protein
MARSAMPRFCSSRCRSRIYATASADPPRP